jgi:hypothetical protein
MDNFVIGEKFWEQENLWCFAFFYQPSPQLQLNLMFTWSKKINSRTILFFANIVVCSRQQARSQVTNHSSHFTLGDQPQACFLSFFPFPSFLFFLSSPTRDLTGRERECTQTMLIFYLVVNNTNENRAHIFHNPLGNAIVTESCPEPSDGF